ncbi:hypothetical protein ABEG18_12960 [Alsobacter sp. KACC 23698]|uniref:DUF2190 family protein n=1 Tax=Alsobacter sp. KACC 23698 TaxID=3149229 RepID=A0AAU7JNG8_9HYPH
MARTVLNKNIGYTTPYTIPAGKYAVFKAFPVANGSGSAVAIGGVMVGLVPSDGLGPLTATAGDTLTGGGEFTAGYGISGFLYDLP